jgi:CRP-like cAMP-binding protein
MNSVVSPMGSNRLLRLLIRCDRGALEPLVERISAAKGTVLYNPGDDVGHTYFPSKGTVVSHVLILKDGSTMQTATVGAEGAIGGIVGAGHRPAYARTVVLTSGSIVRIKTDCLEKARSENRRLDDLVCRYADALLAQIMQSVGCNALHPIEQRCSRWLLALKDRIGNVIPMTQEVLAEVLGVQRTTLSRTAAALRTARAIDYSRGYIEIVDHARLRALSCECYDAVEKHYRRLLPPVPASQLDLASSMLPNAQTRRVPI